MFILLKSATSGDNKTWNISVSTDANQMKLVSTPPFSGMRNSFLLLLVQTFTTRRHYKQLNTILTLTKFLDKNQQPVGLFQVFALFPFVQIVSLEQETKIHEDSRFLLCFGDEQQEVGARCCCFSNDRVNVCICYK